MNTYKVTGTYTATIEIEVEANNRNEAIDVAHEKFGGITNFAGFGDCEHLIGVSGEKETIVADGCEEWNDVELIDGEEPEDENIEGDD